MNPAGTVTAAPVAAGAGFGVGLADRAGGLDDGPVLVDVVADGVVPGWDAGCDALAAAAVVGRGAA